MHGLVMRMCSPKGANLASSVCLSGGQRVRRDGAASLGDDPLLPVHPTHAERLRLADRLQRQASLSQRRHKSPAHRETSTPTLLFGQAGGFPETSTTNHTVRCTHASQSWWHRTKIGVGCGSPVSGSVGSILDARKKLEAKKRSRAVGGRRGGGNRVTVPS